MNLPNHFSLECEFTICSSLTTPESHDRLSAKEGILVYHSKVPLGCLFETFRNRDKSILPGIVTLVQSYHIRPATSVASERLFSSANYIQRKYRSSLASYTLKYSMVLCDLRTL